MSYSSWYNIAIGSNANATLAGITNAAYAGDPAGTDCDSNYWEGRAYDQIRELYVALGSNPGSGIDGSTFTVNQDNTSNDAEDSILAFSRGAAVGGAASIRWDASETYFLLNQNLTSTNSIGTSGTPIPNLYATSLDVASNSQFDGDIDVDGTATIATLTVSGTTTLSTLSLGGNLGFDGTLLTFNEDYTGGSPSENASIVVERGTETNAVLRWNETDDEWEAYNLGAAAYNTLALFDSNGFTDSGVFEGSGGNYGTANYAARSDHNHSGGSLNATGTDESGWTIDEDYTSGSVNIDLKFGAAGNRIRFNPGGNAFFEFSDHAAPDTNNTHDLGTSSLKWRDLYLADDATIDGDIVHTGEYTGSMIHSGTAFTFKTNAGARSVDADIDVDRGSNVDTRIRWDESETKWMYTNDGTNYYYFVGADDSTDSVALPGDLSVAGNVTGTTTFTGTEVYFGVAGSDFELNVPRPSGFDARLHWDYSEGYWAVDNGTGSSLPIASRTGTETLTNKTLTSPTVSSPSINSGGSWAGSPTFSGDPVFSSNPSFTGVPAFTADHNSRPNFNTTVGYAPFTVTAVGTGVTTTVTNLDADRLDGYHSTAFMKLDGSQAMTADLDMGGFNVTNLGNLSHASTHQAGGADEFDGILGQATGTNYTTWTVNADASNANGTKLDLGSSGTYFMSIVNSAAGYLGLGGSSIDLVPGSAVGNQDLGASSRRWRAAYINDHVNLNLQASAPSGLANGSLWAKSGTPQELYAYLGGSSIKVIDADGDSAITGLTGPVTVTGDLQVTGTLTATIGAHTHSAADITSGLVPIAYGGSNHNSFTDEQFLKYDSGNNRFESSGYTFSSFALASHNHSGSDINSGLVPVVYGGSNNNSYTDTQFLLFDLGNNRFQSSGYSASSFATASHNHSASDINAGTLPITYGGLGHTSFTAGDFIYYNSGTGRMESSGYSSGSFATSSHNHAASEITSGILPIAQGGTGKNSFTHNEILIFNTTNQRLESSGYTTSSFSSSGHTHSASTITSGTLGVSYGGTGANSFTAGEFVYYHALNGKLQASGYSPSSFSVVGHEHSATTDITSGTLPIGRGGTGQTSFTDGEVVKYNSTSGYLESTGIAAGDIVTGSHTHNATTDITSGFLSVARGGTGNTSFTTGQFIFYNGSQFAGTGIQYTDVALKSGFTFTGNLTGTGGSKITLGGGANGTDALELDAGTRIKLNSNSDDDTYIYATSPSGAQMWFTTDGVSQMYLAQAAIYSRVEHVFDTTIDAAGDIEVAQNIIMDGAGQLHYTTTGNNIYTTLDTGSSLELETYYGGVKKMGIGSGSIFFEDQVWIADTTGSNHIIHLGDRDKWISGVDIYYDETNARIVFRLGFNYWYLNNDGSTTNF